MAGQQNKKTPSKRGMHRSHDFLVAPQLSIEPIKVNSFSTIINATKFIDSHIEILKSNNGNKIFSPYYDRLIELKHFFEKEKKP